MECGARGSSTTDHCWVDKWHWDGGFRSSSGRQQSHNRQRPKHMEKAASWVGKWSWDCRRDNQFSWAQEGKLQQRCRAYKINSVGLKSVGHMLFSLASMAPMLHAFGKGDDNSEIQPKPKPCVFQWGQPTSVNTCKWSSVASAFPAEARNCQSHFFRHWRFIGGFSGICVFHTAFVVLRCASQALKGSKMLSLCWRIAYTKESNAAWHKFERNNIQMYTDALFFSQSVSVFIIPLPPLLGTQPTCLGWKDYRHTHTHSAKTLVMFIMFRSFLIPIPKKNEGSRCTSWRGQLIWSSNRMKWFAWFDVVQTQHQFWSQWHLKR